MWAWTNMLFQPYHDAEDEPTAEPLDPTFFDFDIGEPLSKEELKGKVQSNKLINMKLINKLELIYNEIIKHNDDRAPILARYT